MVSNLIQKIRKIPWVLGQKLTQRPGNPNAVISDLFVWRVGQDWETYFELLDLNGLFGVQGEHYACIVFFDREGRCILQEKVSSSNSRRKTLNIGELLSRAGEASGEYGTFCVFHNQLPKTILDSGSFLAERGYTRYRYKSLPLGSYVHGNLDAIDSDLNLLSGNSILKRSYNLQYKFTPENRYEVVLVNANARKQKVLFKILNFSGEVQMEECVLLEAGQVCILHIENLQESSRLVIWSRMIMARPVVFCLNHETMDVFHG